MTKQYKVKFTLDGHQYEEIVTADSQTEAKNLIIARYSGHKLTCVFVYNV